MSGPENGQGHVLVDVLESDFDRHADLDLIGRDTVQPAVHAHPLVEVDRRQEDRQGVLKGRVEGLYETVQLCTVPRPLAVVQVTAMEWQAGQTGRG